MKNSESFIKNAKSSMGNSKSCIISSAVETKRPAWYTEDKLDMLQNNNKIE